jgi:hypothetical protein
MKIGNGIAKAGKLILIDEGSYSDYTIICFCVVLKDFDPMKELGEYKIEHKDKIEEMEDNRYLSGAFLAALIAKGYLLEIDFGKLHLADRCDDVCFTTG